MLTFQLGGAVAALMLLVLAPPVSGNLLLLPLSAAAEVRLLPLALARGGRLVGRGPLPGSFVVEGVRGGLAGPLAAAGILTLAAPPGGCGRDGDPDAQR